MRAYVYSLNLKGGRKYVGYTTQPVSRLRAHYRGRGAQWTRKHGVVSVNRIQRYRSIASAKRGERAVYRNMARYHGRAKVRGAGHTKSW